MDNKSLQSIMMNCNNNISLKFGEYEGPLIIDRPITLDGSGSTIWSKSGPVIVIKSIGVKLKNLKITVPRDGSALSNISIEVKKGIQVEFENVYVNGTVIGISGEEGTWMYPSSAQLSELQPLKENRYYLDIYAPGPANMNTDISGAALVPNKIVKGLNKVEICLSDIYKDAFVCGKVYIESYPGIRRSIELYGSALKSNSKGTNNSTMGYTRIWSPDKSDLDICLDDV